MKKIEGVDGSAIEYLNFWRITSFRPIILDFKAEYSRGFAITTL